MKFLSITKTLKYITILIYYCVLTVCNTLYKFVTTQRNGLCKICVFQFIPGFVKIFNNQNLYLFLIYSFNLHKPF